MDCFEPLDLPRAPWVDPELLQKKFHSLSNEIHPDRFSSPEEKQTAEKRFAEINRAWQTLRSTKSRLSHLVELETGEKLPHVQEVPEDAVALFPAVAALTRSVDQFLAEASQASPMLRVQHFEQALSWTEQVQDLQGKIGSIIRRLEEEACKLTPAWQEAPPPGDKSRTYALPLDPLRKIAAAIGFLEKWNAQLSDKLARLATV